MVLKWETSALRLSDRLASNLKSFKDGETLVKEGVNEDTTCLIFPVHSDIFIADEERVKAARTLREITDYYQKKHDYLTEEAVVYQFVGNGFSECRFAIPPEVDRSFDKLIDRVHLNILDVPSLQKIPFYILNKIRCFMNEQSNSNHGFLNFLIEFYSLCALSTRVDYIPSSETYRIQFPKQNTSGSIGVMTFEVAWKDAEYFSSSLFSSILSWVMNEQGIPNSLEIRKRLAHNYISNFEVENLLKGRTNQEILDAIDSLDLMLQAFVNEKSDKFIREMKNIKDEYIYSFNEYMQLTATTNSQTLANIFALGVAIYGIFTKYWENGSDGLPINMIKIFSLIFIFSTLIILINMIINLRSLNKTRDERRAIYSVMLGIDDETLKSLYNQHSPKLPKTYRFQVVLLLLIIAILAYVFNNPTIVSLVKLK